MSDPLVQNQQPLTQAADQKPVYQRGIDPRKLQSFIMQEHYKTKIKTILGDDNPETAEIYNLEGMTWKEKFAEAKTRTSPIIDQIDKFEMDTTTTADDMIKYYQTHGYKFDKNEQNSFMSSLSTVKSRAATKAAKQRQMQKDFDVEKEQHYKLEEANELFRSKAEFEAVNIEQKINELTGKHFATAQAGNSYKFLISKIEHLLGNNESGSWGKISREEIRQVRKAVFNMTQDIKFPEKDGYVNEAGQFIPWGFDADNPKIARDRFTDYIMKKLENVTTNAQQIKDFIPTQPEYKQALQQQQPQGETWENVAPHIQQAENPESKKYNTNDGTLTGTPINTNGTIDVGKYQVNSKWIVQKGENFAYNQQGEKDSLWWDIQDAIKQDVPTWDTMSDDQRMETMATNDSLNTKVSKMIFDARGLEQWSTADTVRQAIGTGTGKSKFQWAKPVTR